MQWFWEVSSLMHLKIDKTKQATPYHDSWFFCNFTAADSHCQFNTKEEAEGIVKVEDN